MAESRFRYSGTFRRNTTNAGKKASNTVNFGEWVKSY